jgi:magnesium transporter
MVTYVPTDFGGEPETALSHAYTQVPTASPDDLIVTTLERMRGRRFDSAGAVAVLDRDRLVGVATIEQMFAADNGATLRDVMD